MRWVARVQGRNDPEMWLSLHDRRNEGVFVFVTGGEDWACDSDYWYPTRVEAIEASREVWGVAEADWLEIGDAPPGCSDDFINPVRLVGGADDRALGPKLELLVAGRWIPVDRGSLPRMQEAVMQALARRKAVMR